MCRWLANETSPVSRTLIQSILIHVMTASWQRTKIAPHLDFSSWWIRKNGTPAPQCGQDSVVVVKYNWGGFFFWLSTYLCSKQKDHGQMFARRIPVTKKRAKMEIVICVTGANKGAKPGPKGGSCF